MSSMRSGGRKGIFGNKRATVPLSVQGGDGEVEVDLIDKPVCRLLFHCDYT